MQKKLAKLFPLENIASMEKTSSEELSPTSASLRQSNKNV